MSFRISGLPAEDFGHLFALDDAELAALGAVRRTAEHPAPCRVSLTDATPGDEVILETRDEAHAHEVIELVRNSGYPVTRMH